MKKSLFIITTIILLSFHPVMAKNVKVQSMSDFSTENPSQTLKLKIVNGFVTKSGYEIKPDTIIIGDVCDVKEPQRLKRNGNFSFIPKKYIDPQTGEYCTIEKLFIGKYSSLTEVTAKKVVETGAITAGNIFIGSFVGPSVALAKGAVQNEEGNRAKSAAISVYESTPLSYISKGKSLEIKEGQTFIMNFKFNDDDENDNDE